MPALHAISLDTLARLVALPGAPPILDLRDARAVTLPGARVLGAATPPTAPAGRAVVVVDAAGGAAAAAAVALLRSDGVRAERLEGGFAAWTSAGLPTVTLAPLPPRHDDGRTWWVTRARPKVDRIACPWLIRRFIDPEARFLYVAPGEVLAVAAAERAGPFRFDAPVLTTLDPYALALALAAGVALFHMRAGVIATLLASVLGGLALHLAGVMP